MIDSLGTQKTISLLFYLELLEASIQYNRSSFLIFYWGICPLLSPGLLYHSIGGTMVHKGTLVLSVFCQS